MNYESPSELLIRAKKLAAEALHLQLAGKYRDALARLEAAAPIVESWGDPTFQTGFYAQMLFLNRQLGHTEKAAICAQRVQEASMRLK